MFSLRMTEQELQRVRQAASSAGLTPSIWARRALLLAAGLTARQVELGELDRREHQRENAAKARSAKSPKPALAV